MSVVSAVGQSMPIMATASSRMSVIWAVCVWGSAATPKGDSPTVMVATTVLLVVSTTQTLPLEPDHAMATSPRARSRAARSRKDLVSSAAPSRISTPWSTREN